jgi:hypothetical protein
MAQETLKIVYSIKNSNQGYEIKKGLVVPVGSTVTVGLTEPSRPTVESSTALFKMLFGIRNKKRAVVEADDDEDIIKVDDSDSSDSEASEAESASEDDKEVDDDED